MFKMSEHEGTKTSGYMSLKWVFCLTYDILEAHKGRTWCQHHFQE